MRCHTCCTLAKILLSLSVTPPQLGHWSCTWTRPLHFLVCVCQVCTGVLLPLLLYYCCKGRKNKNNNVHFFFIVKFSRTLAAVARAISHSQLRWDRVEKDCATEPLEHTHTCPLVWLAHARASPSSPSFLISQCLFAQVFSTFFSLPVLFKQICRKVSVL